ncbi:hypothetical protein GGQ84_000462 [Desulfitispora alkaliphila]|uniref:hypothetical protein n=1 Tax=Desulfitispora alkaliphila TaxID=622674 RepID=UPI003D2087FB
MYSKIIKALLLLIVIAFAILYFSTSNRNTSQLPAAHIGDILAPKIASGIEDSLKNRKDHLIISISEDELTYLLNHALQTSLKEEFRVTGTAATIDANQVAYLINMRPYNLFPLKLQASIVPEIKESSLHFFVKELKLWNYTLPTNTTARVLELSQDRYFSKNNIAHLNPQERIIVITPELPNFVYLKNIEASNGKLNTTVSLDWDIIMSHLERALLERALGF